VVTLARRLRRKRPKGGQRSLRDIAAELAQRGHLKQGRPFSAASVRSTLVRPPRDIYPPRQRCDRARGEQMRTRSLNDWF
jgi:hypothetical protein